MRRSISFEFLQVINMQWLAVALLLAGCARADFLEVLDEQGQVRETMSKTESEHFLDELFHKEQGFTLLLVDFGNPAAEHKMQRFRQLGQHFHDGVLALRLVVSGTRVASKQLESWWVEQTKTYVRTGNRYDAKWLGGSFVCLVRSTELVGGVFWESPSDLQCVSQFFSSRPGMGSKMDAACQLLEIHEKDFHPLFAQKIDRAPSHEDL